MLRAFWDRFVAKLKKGGNAFQTDRTSPTAKLIKLWEKGAINIDDVEYLLKHDKNTATPLKGNGDFRSEECIKLLKEADIVVTNPPFSLFREYVAQLHRAFYRTDR